MRAAKAASTRKAAKVENANAEFKVWCDCCSIRIAPSEERTVVRGKIYHRHCYSKISAKAKE